MAGAKILKKLFFPLERPHDGLGEKEKLRGGILINFIGDFFFFFGFFRN